LELLTELPGRSWAFRTAEIRPQVSGLIQRRLFNEGSDVKEGQVLYQIDPAPFKSALANAEANLAVARKAADRARAALEASTASVLRYRAILDLAKSNLARIEEAFKERAVAATQMDQAINDEKVAQASLTAAEAQVKSDREAVGLAEAAILQAEAAVETARINLGYTRVTAPIAGRIGKSNVTEGAIVTAYQPMALATIQQLDPVYVDVPHSTTQLLRLRKRLEEGRLNKAGDNHSRVALLLEDGSRYEQEGILQFQDVTVDPTTGSVTLRIVFPNPRGILLPGMFVRAVIREGENEAAILIPQQAVSRDPKGNPIIHTVSADGKVGMRPIILDRAVYDNWLVTSGLQAGERIIVEGLQKVRPEMVVKAVPFEKKTRDKASPVTPAKVVKAH
jgi:membrane fusion protein (multidrug efflux system)